MNKQATIYAVINRKGGTGKTTSSVNLSDGLNRRARQSGSGSDFNVLIIDLDPQGHTAKALNVDPQGKCVSQVLVGGASIRDVIVPASTAEHKRPGLWIIPASDELAAAKRILIGDDAMEVFKQFQKSGGSTQLSISPKINTILRRYLEPLRNVFQYIILDCPPTLDSLQTAVYDYADHVIVPVKTDYLAVAGTLQHTQNILDEQTDGIDIKIRGIIPTFVDTRSGQTKRVLQTLVKTYGRSRVLQPIPHTVKLAEAPEFGMTIFEYADSTGDKYARTAATAYNRIVEAIA